jgi:hypothetical protein
MLGFMRPLLALMLVSAVACAPDKVKVGKVNLAEADGVEPAPEGPMIEVPGGEIPSKLSGPVRVAIDSGATYATALHALTAVKRAGGTPVILVIRRNDVVAFPLFGGSRGPKAILVKARTDGTGCKPGSPVCVQACISPPDNDEAQCVHRPDGMHIDRAFVRQLVYKAFKQWQLSEIHVTVDQRLAWADAVRAIDGARTCCGDGAVTVTVEPGID